MAPTSRVNQPRPPGRRRALAAGVLTLVVGLLLTGVASRAEHDSAHREAEQRFTESADQTAASVQQTVAGYFDKLRDVGAFVANSPDASAEQFHGYLNSTGIFDRIPSLAGLFFIERVPEAELDTFLARVHERDPAFSLFKMAPHQPGEPYLLLTYYVPGKVDLAFPIGTDIAAIPSVNDLMKVSTETGDGIVGSFQDDPVLQDLAHQTDFPLLDTLLGLDFFLGMPVSSTSAVAGQPAPPPLGWVGAPVADFGDVVAATTTGLPDSLGLSLTVDLTRAGLAGRGDLARVAEQEGAAGPQDRAAFETSAPFQTEGVDWSVDIWSSADADAVPIAVPIILIGGTIASLLAAGMVYFRFRARDRERTLASKLADREQFQNDILDSVTNAMVVLDARGGIVRANPAWSKLWALTRGGPGDGAGIDEDYLEVLSPRVRSGSAELAGALHDVLDGRREVAEADTAVDEGSRHRWYTVRATPLRGRKGGAVVVHTDITERKRTHDELELKATHDNLTGLLNRLAIEGEIERVLELATAEKALVAALFIDLDGFKPVNDTFGHAIGDEVLRTVAQRISRSVRAGDQVARLGGDEFVVLIGPLDNPEIAEITAERILAGLCSPLHIEGNEIPLTASIGIAIVDRPLDATLDRLIQRADAAMYVSKQQGGSRVTMAP